MTAVNPPPSPNPSWKPGDSVRSPVDEMVSLDASTQDPLSLYRLLIGSIVPRPIAWVSTRGLGGAGNLAPFSFFNGVCSRPPSLMFSVAQKPDGTPKDTLKNILETKEFVVNFASEWLAEPLHYTGADLEYGMDEMKKAGLTPLPATRVNVDRVKESPIHLECKLYDTLQVGDGGVGSSTIVVGEILVAHIAKEAYSDGKILLDQIKPISRLAGRSYGRTSGVFDLQPPQIKKGS